VRRRSMEVSSPLLPPSISLSSISESCHGNNSSERRYRRSAAGTTWRRRKAGPARCRTTRSTSPRSARPGCIAGRPSRGPAAPSTAPAKSSRARRRRDRGPRTMPTPAPPTTAQRSARLPTRSPFAQPWPEL
jgi:hypothetical protein